MDFKEWQQDEVNRRIFLRGVKVLIVAVGLLYLWLILTGGGVE